MERVRVKDPVSGHEFTTTRDHAEGSGLTILNTDAVDSFGRDLPTVHAEPKKTVKENCS